MLLDESVISYIRSSLDLTIWTQDGRLIGAVKDEILSRLQEGLQALGLRMEDVVRDVLIIGSITGKQYLPTSDIDVTVLIQDYIKDDVWLRVREYFTKNVNGFKIGQHPVNFYFARSLNLETTTGAYSLFTDTWLKPPVDVEPFDPEQKYQKQYQVARKIADGIVEIISELRRDLMDLDDLKNVQDGFYNRLYVMKQFEIFTGVIALNGILRQVKKERDKAFQGPGAQESVGNIVYKFLERYGYLEQLLRINEAKKQFYKELTSILK